MDKFQIGRAGELAIELYALVNAGGAVDVYARVADHDSVDLAGGMPGAPRRSTGATMIGMARVITQRTLRNESGEIMRGLDRGESYIVTRDGVPVGELLPVRRRMFVPAATLLGALAGAPPINGARFRKDVDPLIDQNPKPRT